MEFPEAIKVLAAWDAAWDAAWAAAWAAQATEFKRIISQED